MTIMVDGIRQDVAAIHARFPSNPVAVYVNGEFAWTPAQEALFARKIRVSVMSGQPLAARAARCLDVEQFAAGPGDVKRFLATRLANGHEDGTIYCSLSTVRDVIDAAGDVNLIPRWWLAWYWGRPGAPTQSQVRAELLRLFGVDLPAGRIWACQYVPHAQWDLSAVYGPEDFSR